MTSKFKRLPSLAGLKKAVIYDKKTTGTAGGTFTLGAWRTRDLNTLEGDTDIVNISANQFTLQPGSYLIYGEASSFNSFANRAVVYNITGAANVLPVGMSGHTGSSDANYNSYFSVQVTITAPNTYEIRHRSTATKTTDGFGKATSFGDYEVYTTVNIIQLREPV